MLTRNASRSSVIEVNPRVAGVSATARSASTRNARNRVYEPAMERSECIIYT